jgi:hypothetical protein
MPWSLYSDLTSHKENKGHIYSKQSIFVGSTDRSSNTKKVWFGSKCT